MVGLFGLPSLFASYVNLLEQECLSNDCSNINPDQVS